MDTPPPYFSVIQCDHLADSPVAIYDHLVFSPPFRLPLALRAIVGYLNRPLYSTFNY